MELDKYIFFTNVKYFNVKFADGTVRKINIESIDKMFLMNIIPISKELTQLEENVYTHFRKVNSVGELATLCNFDQVKTFSRHFKKTFGQSPYKWMLDRKHDEIHTLVVNSNLAFSEIAKIYGFNSTSHFCSAYRNRHGKSPTETREAILIP